MLIGVFFPQIPYIGVLGSWSVPLFPLWVMIFALIGGVLSLIASHAGLRSGLGFAMLAVMVIIGTVVIATSMVRVAEDHGAQVNLLQTLRLKFLFSKTDHQPDETITYSSHNGEDIQADIYLPQQDEKDELAPIILYIHGGGWILNDRSYRSANMRWFADQGFVTVSIDYTLATEDLHTWDLVDSQVACALTWVVKNASRFNADPENITLTGDSAGGNLAINVGYAANAGTLTSSCGGQVPQISRVAVIYPAVDPQGIYETTDPVFGNFDRSFTRQYIGGSPAEYPERYAATTSINYIHPDAPPTMVLIGNNDHLVPIEGTLEFVRQAEQAGIDIQLIRFPYGDHGFDLPLYSIGNQASQQIIRDFIESQSNGKR
jgi:acetyl esterase/lipase